MNGEDDFAQAGDVQRLVGRGYKLDCCRHFVLKVTDPPQARNFLEALCRGGFLVPTPSRQHGGVPAPPPQQGVDVGFTFQGLVALELHPDYLNVFREKAGAFADGPIARAATFLADTGANAPARWDGAFQSSNAHVLVCTHAGDRARLDALASALGSLPGAARLANWDSELEGHRLYRGSGECRQSIEHFGFPDGISIPGIRGIQRPHRGRRLYAPGEFLLGYPDEDGVDPWRLINPGNRTNPWLLPDNRAADLAGFFRNGSFGVLRKMEQDVAGYADSLDRWALLLGAGRDTDQWRAYVAAKLSGRWANGSVVKPGQVTAPQAPPGHGSLNEFDFSDDRAGDGCPFGSHIRRMNPRSDPVVPFRSRPLIRRGMPYGEPYQPGEQGGPRGLLGLFFCASLEDQFEHLIGQWANANPMGPDNRGRAKDPIIGRHERPLSSFDIPMPDRSRRQLDGFERRVTTRGTLYAFFPGIRGVSRIARRGLP